MIIDLVQVIGVSESGNHAALVHFSDPTPVKSGVLFNLAFDNDLATIQSLINGVNVPSILGITALDL